MSIFELVLCILICVFIVPISIPRAQAAARAHRLSGNIAPERDATVSGYMKRAAELGADPARDVVCFVDDSRTNCDAGAAAGLRSVLFEGDSAECRTGLIAEGFWELRV